MVELIPSQDTLMQILKRTGAFREGHFVYPNGKHSPHYFQMPLAFRYYDTARVLAVALSRKFRLEKDISSQLPKVAIPRSSVGSVDRPERSSAFGTVVSNPPADQERSLDSCVALPTTW